MVIHITGVNIAKLTRGRIVSVQLQQTHGFGQASIRGPGIVGILFKHAVVGCERVGVVRLAVINLSDVVLSGRREIGVVEILQIVGKLLEGDIVFAGYLIAIRAGIERAGLQTLRRAQEAPTRGLEPGEKLALPSAGGTVPVAGGGAAAGARTVLMRFSRSAILASSLPMRVFMSSTDSRTARKSSDI